MVIGKLSVLLGLDTSQFTTGMKTAASQVQGFQTTLSGASGALAAIGLVAGGVRAGLTVAQAAINRVSGAIGGLMDKLQEIKETGKTAKKLGVTTESLLGLRYAASAAGINVEQFERALIQMQRRLSEAVHKGGEISKTLGALNLSPTILAAMPPDQAFLKVADALSRVKSQADRVRLSVELFGESGQQMILLLSQGPEKIRLAMAEAERLGMTYSAEQAAMAAEATKKIAELRAQWEGLKQQMAVATAPAITAWVGGLDIMLAYLRGRGEEEVRAKTMELVAQRTKKAAAAQSEYNEKLVEAAELAAKARKTADELITSMEGDVRFAGFGNLERQLAELTMAGAFELPTGGIDYDRFNRARNAIIDLRKMEAEKETIEQRRRELEDLADAGRRVTESVMTPMEQFAKRQADANRLLQVGAISWQTYTREMAAATNEMIRQESVKGPALIERGSQADFASEAVWRARSEQLGAGRADQPAGVAGLAEAIRNDPNAPEMLRRLDAIRIELVEVKEHNRSTSASSRRTAVAVERTEQPEVVDM